jgi:hypothetical protein
MDERDDYIDFIEQLSVDLGNPAKGIALQGVRLGRMDLLSPKQHMVVSLAVQDWLKSNFPRYESVFLNERENPAPPNCSECGETVPWCEVYLAGSMYNGRCSYCEQVHHKND